MLLDNGVDLHSYQPTAQDILKISTCDLFIYVGGESDGWVSDLALQEAATKRYEGNGSSDAGRCRQRGGIVEGMEAGEHGDGKKRSTKEEEEGPEYDTTFGCPSRNAKVFCEAITNAPDRN